MYVSTVERAFLGKELGRLMCYYANKYDLKKQLLGKAVPHVIPDIRVFSVHTQSLLFCMYCILAAH